MDSKACGYCPKLRSVGAIRRNRWHVRVVEGTGRAVLAATGDEKPAGATPGRNYLAGAFGALLDDGRAAMEALVARFPPENLRRGGFQIYKALRFEVPEGVTAWGTHGER